MGTSPALEFANDFAFWHEYEFLSHMAQEHKQYGPCRYPFEFITQHADSTKIYIDDIFTVFLGHTTGSSLQYIILQNCIFYGMYSTTVREFDGNVRLSPISIVCEQIGFIMRFLDTEILQPLPELCEVNMHNKRDNMLAHLGFVQYRKFSHIETTVSVSCKYAVLHSQLDRFSYRCTKRVYFIVAASRLIRDIYGQVYDLKLLRRNLHNFQS